MSRRDTLESTTRLDIAEHHLADVAQRLRRVAGAALQRAQTLKRPILAWTTIEVPLLDPLALLEHREGSPTGRLLWLRPEDRFGLAGVGSAWTLTAEGGDRFPRAETAWRSILDQAVGNAHGGGAEFVGSQGAGPIALYGFAFEPRGPAGLPHRIAYPQERRTDVRPGSGRADGGSSKPDWEGYPAGLVVIPRLTARCVGGRSWLTLSVVADPDRPFPAEAYEDAIACLHICEDAVERGIGAPHEGGAANAVGWEAHPLHVVDEFPSEAAWKASVRATARAVREGRLRKAVLARGVRVQGGRLDPSAALRRLRADYPGCTLFAVAREGRCFLGATPERLVRVRDGEVAVEAVAGSAPRGLTEDEDRRLGEMLLDSPKDRIEHAMVVEVLRDALAGICTAISGDDSPQLLTVRNTHHLYTRLRASLRDRRTVLDLAGRLHPTPAVGGVPREEALQWIRDHEGWDRGWYAGLIGWMDGTGEGETAVAIRSALVGRTEAVLFAGCGIVADSDPDQEYAESCWKLQPLLSALSEAPPGEATLDAAPLTGA